MGFGGDGHAARRFGEGCKFAKMFARTQKSNLYVSTWGGGEIDAEAALGDEIDRRVFIEVGDDFFGFENTPPSD